MTKSAFSVSVLGIRYLALHYISSFDLGSDRSSWYYLFRPSKRKHIKYPKQLSQYSEIIVDTKTWTVKSGPNELMSDFKSITDLIYHLRQDKLLRDVHEM